MISPKIKINKETVINPGDLIFNPVENVHYKVQRYLHSYIHKTQVADLVPLEPFGTSKHPFTISVEEMNKLEYELQRG